MHSKPFFLLLFLMVTLALVVIPSEAQTQAKMKYLVVGDFIDPGPMMSPPQVAQMLETAILPSLDMLTKWEADNRIHGGIFVGDRKGVFVIEAESNGELDKMIMSLPMWGLMKWTVSPLHTFAGRAAQDKMNVEKIKSMKK